MDTGTLLLTMVNNLALSKSASVWSSELAQSPWLPFSCISRQCVLRCGWVVVTLDCQLRSQLKVVHPGFF